MLSLPPELLPQILVHLSYLDLHSLSLTCSFLYDQVHTTLEHDDALYLTCKNLVPWIHRQQKPKYSLWKDILNRILDTQFSGDPVKHIDTSTLTPTHRFVVPKRRPKMHQNTPFVGVPLVKARSPVHIHELGVSVENGHFLFVHDIINTSQYRLDVSSMHKRDVNEKEARNYLDWGFPRFMREPSGYRYKTPEFVWKFELNGEFLDDLYALNCGSTLFAILVGVQSGGLYFLKVESEDPRPIVLFLPSTETHNPIPPRAQLQQTNGAVFATVCYPETEQPEMMFLDFDGHVINRLFAVSSRDLNCAFMVRASDLFLVLGGELVRVAVDFSSGGGAEVVSRVGHVSAGRGGEHMTSNYVSSPRCYMVSISSLSCDSLRYRAHLDLDNLFGKYAIFWNHGGFAALLDLENHVVTKLQNDTDMLSLVSWVWSGDEGRSSGNGQIHVCRYTIDFLKGLEA
ncbi:hypothetical protein B0I72DRAFT_136139 [Yarrowia lipolytica]|uniref:Uncharacterized protein n=1 Tax=Yarrowia lipolytica TaxID=4952 RepID=A0A371BY80_YARLL|nr:Hypothetical protein YALI2_D00278g [Yarrowia lipolytica]RDW23055.1 hypothetical protein B0I71DRAFT_136572 [Yarrowia lipolytica]RDW33551.1 hypothetical protein B0I72DRAFT_136139 [Yarrowia lipolytica]RDW41595.1 hypothetical protein B0I73DRAFT_128523 [Yarrowia lipolytica]RDW44963.1 hypothetical protein B0I74DRAFT_139564 [Yarrowia lipolytica]